MSVFENDMLKGKFGHKSEEVAEGWRKQHGIQFVPFAKYSSIIIIRSRRMRLTGHVARMKLMVY
jgi:hypothetical protein